MSIEYGKIYANFPKIFKKGLTFEKKYGILS